MTEPRANPDLVGHETAEASFLDAYNAGRPHHAWLICGPKGVGKATLAHRIARFLLVDGGGEAGGAGLFGDAPLAAESLHVDPDHPVFRRIAAGGHADMLTVERQVNPKTGKLRSEIIVDDVREVAAFMSKTAGEGGWRVVVIDSADEMNRNAANAVLKVLEEPPPRAMLLLVAHNPGRLLPTIRSRCRKMVLRPLPDDAVANIVAARAAELGPDDARILARLAEGSVGRALELAEQGGLAFHGQVMALLETLPNLDGAAMHALGDAAARTDAAFDAVAGLVRWWLGRLIAFAAGNGARVSDEERALMTRLSGAAPVTRWLDAWERVDDIVGGGRALNLDRKQMALGLFLALGEAARGK